MDDCQGSLIEVSVGSRGHVLAPFMGIQDRAGPAALVWEAVVAWIVLCIAGCFEVVWATAMKQSDGLTRLWPSVVALAGVLASLLLLSWSMRSLALGTAYLAWTGIGAVGTLLVGVLWLGESASILSLSAAVMIVGGVVLMRFASSP